MEIAALVVSVVSVLVAAGALWYARRSDRSAAQSAVAAATTAALDVQRRNAELTPGSGSRASRRIRGRRRCA